MRRSHALLNRIDIVGHAPEFDNLMFKVGNGKSSPGIAVAGLADGTGIEKIPAALFDAEGGERLGAAWMNLQDLERGIVVTESALMMRVSEKCDFGGGV